MKFKIVATIVFLSASLGAYAAFEDQQVREVDRTEYAKYAVVVNGSTVDIDSSEFDYSGDSFVLAEKNSNIIQKKSENLTWTKFVEEVPLGVENTSASDICVSFSETEFCGNGGVLVNGERENLDKDVEQGDTLVIVVSTRNWRDVTQYLGDTDLPERYRPFWLKGEKV